MDKSYSNSMKIKTEFIIAIKVGSVNHSRDKGGSLGVFPLHNKTNLHFARCSVSRSFEVMIRILNGMTQQVRSSSNKRLQHLHVSSMKMKFILHFNNSSLLLSPSDDEFESKSDSLSATVIRYGSTCQ
jgi:hypothetical protein